MSGIGLLSPGMAKVRPCVAQRNLGGTKRQDYGKTRTVETTVARGRFTIKHLHTLTAMTTPFHELAGSPVETYGPTGLTARRTLACAWADRHALVRALLGDGYRFGGGGSRAAYPTASAVVAMTVRVEPLMNDPTGQPLAGLSDGLSAYHGFAQVTVDYELVDQAELTTVIASEPGTLLTYRTEPVEERLRLPGDRLSWSGNPGALFPAESEGTVRLPAVRHRLTWRRVMRPPWSAIRRCTGALSGSEFLGVAPGALLFEGVAASREFLRLSELNEAEHVWRLEYAFRENPLCPAATEAGFRAEDFTALFQFDS